MPCGADLDAQRADIADDTAPQGIVQIADHALCQPPETCEHEIYHGLGNLGQVFQIAEGLAQIPQPLVEPAAASGVRGNCLDVAKQYIRPPRGGLGDLRIQRARRGVDRGAEFQIELSEGSVIWQSQVALDDATAAMFREAIPDALDPRQFRVDAMLVIAGSQRLRTVDDNGEVRLEGVKRGRRVDGLQLDRIEQPLIKLRADAVVTQQRAQDWHELLGRGIR